jgi:hypothetical protein
VGKIEEIFDQITAVIDGYWSLAFIKFVIPRLG